MYKNDTKASHAQRWLALILAAVMVLAMMPSALIRTAYADNRAAGAAPASVSVNWTEFSVLNNGNPYQSEALGTGVYLRDIPVDTSDGTKGWAFCYAHGLDLKNRGNNTWNYISTVNVSSAAPFVDFYSYHMENSEWSAWLASSTASWIQVAIWLEQEGIFTDYNDENQLLLLAKERDMTLSLFGMGGDLEASLTLVKQIVSMYKDGTYGNWTYNLYNHASDGSIQPLLLAVSEPEPTQHEVYVKLSKTAQGGTNYHAGATFGVYSDANCTNELTRFISTATEWSVSGIIDIKSPTATLWVKEISSGSSSLQKDANAYSVYVDASVNNTAATAAAVAQVIDNISPPPPPDSESIICKIDALTGGGIGPATFQLEGDAEDGGYISKSVTSDSSGNVELQWLDPAGEDYIKPGYYMCSEKTPPSGYQKTDAVQYLKLWLEWVKDDAYDEGGYYVPLNSGPLTFENHQKHSVTLSKVNASGKGLPGAVFDVYRNGTILHAGIKTGPDGTIVLSEIESGLYTFIERSAPSGFVPSINGNSASVYVDATNTAITNHYVNMTNYEYPDIVIEKYDIESNQPLAGAVFEVTIDGTTLGTFKTSSNGTINITHAQYGKFLNEKNDSWTVRVEEQMAPNGYFLSNPNWQENEIRKGQTLSPFVFKNQSYPDIVVYKRDAVSNDLLEHVEFTLTHIHGTIADRVAVTDKDGRLVFERVPDGTYLLSETSVPPGYILSDKTYTVIVKEGCDPVLEYEYKNDRKPSLTIYKKCSITGDPLENVGFSITCKDSQGGTHKLGDFYTDQDGKIEFEHLDAAWIQATELAPPNGYAIRPGEGSQELFLKPNGTYTMTFENVPLSAIIIQKTDNDNPPAPLAGAVFELRYLGGDTSGSGGVTVGRYTSSANGTCVITGLERGYYIIEEVSPPPGHSLSPESIQTVFISGKDQDIITVTFQNQRNPGFLLIKRDGTDRATPLAGAVYKITDSDGSVIGDNNGLFETTEDGTIYIPNLTPGMTLLVQEVKAPDSYQLDSQVYTVKLNGSGAYELILYNEKLKDFVLTKLDGSDQKTPLQGVEYFITYADGAVVAGGSNGYFTTDENGKITLTGLSVGDVIQIQETKPKDDSYILDGTVYTYTIEAGANAKAFYNERRGGLLLTKRDEVTNALLAGVQYKITYADGTVVGSSNGLFTTDKKGEIRLTQSFEPGTTLLITEVKAKSGYLQDETVHSITIKEPDTLYTITAYNTPIGGVGVIKIDASSSKTRIPNIEFEIREMNGAYVGSYTTNKQGQFFAALEPGWYTLTETSTGKTGYILDPTPINFEVKEGEVTTLRVKNEKATRILIHKTDSVTEKGIPNVKFLLMDSGKNPIMTLETDQDGYAYIDASEKLTEGKYYLQELEAKGYVLDKQIRTVYLEAGKCTTIEWENTPEQGQIIITKRSAQFNEVTNLPAGSLLSGSVFEVYSLTGNLVDRMVSNAKGIAASSLLPVGVYIVKEVSPTPYYALNTREFIAEIRHSGDIVRFEVLNENATLGVTIQKKGQNQAVPGQIILWELFNVASTASTPMESFYVHDRLPTDAVRGAKVFTGTWSHRLTYQVTYKTNYSSDYRVLASGLSTKTDYELSIHPNVLGLQSGEYVTDIRWEFGTVPVGFQSAINPKIQAQVLPTLPKGYKIINRADVGGRYISQWETAQTSWTTIIYSDPAPATELPKTGY